MDDLLKFVVQPNERINFNDRFYCEGDIIELPQDVAAGLPARCIRLYESAPEEEKGDELTGDGSGEALPPMPDEDPQGDPLPYEQPAPRPPIPNWKKMTIQHLEVLAEAMDIPQRDGERKPELLRRVMEQYDSGGHTHRVHNALQHIRASGK